MANLPEPHFKARAKANIIRARAGTIADVAGRVSAMEVEKLQPEEWDVILDSMQKLIDELQAEYDDFAQYAKCMI